MRDEAIDSEDHDAKEKASEAIEEAILIMRHLHLFTRHDVIRDALVPGEVTFPSDCRTSATVSHYSPDDPITMLREIVGR